MKVVAIYGSERKGSTYHIVQMFLKELEQEITHLDEFFLPRDMPHFCKGCLLCVTKGEEWCPHADQVAPIRDAIDAADLIILSSAVYVMRATGQMKVLLDHFPARFMIHRPEPTMFSKVALVVSTAAGGGMKSTIKDMKTSLKYWGVGKIYTYGEAVRASSWKGIKPEKKQTIQKQVTRITTKIKKAVGHVTPSLKVKSLFYTFRMLHKRIDMNEIDKQYWESKGWLKGSRPWDRH